MAARPAPFDALHVAEATPAEEDGGDSELLDPRLEVLGRLVSQAAALRVLQADPDDESRARIAELEAASETWRRRAFAEAAAREAEAAAAFTRQRELVTVLHRQLIANEQLHAALAWQRRAWWRRVGRRAPAVELPLPTPA